MFSAAANFIDGLSTNNKRTTLIAGGFGFCFLLITLIVFMLSPSEFEPLYSNLNNEDNVEVVNFLNKQGYSYRMKGSDILVKSTEILNIRMLLAADGIPTSGNLVGYELFNKSDSLSSSGFTQNVNLIRALEGELSRTISSFKSVRNSRVHIVLPRKEIFLKDRHQASASVVLKLRSGYDLSRKEVSAVANIISSAVPGLSKNNITIVTTDGKLLHSSSGEGYAVSTDYYEYKIGVENNLRDVVESLVSRHVGIGKVRAEVNAELNFDIETISREVYDPAGRVLRSEQVSDSSRNSNSPVDGGQAGISSSIPGGEGGGADGAGSSNSNESRTEEVRNYEISKEIRSTKKESGNIKRLSIAVMVDGHYVKEGDSLKYSPRDDEELSKLKSLIASAVGFSDERGDVIEVVNMQFSEDSSMEEESGFVSFLLYNLQSIIGNVITAVVVILISFFVFKPLMNRVFDLAVSSSATPGLDAATSQDIEEEGGVEVSIGQADGEGDTVDVEVGFKEDNVKKLNDCISKNPLSTVNIIRRWLHGNNAL